MSWLSNRLLIVISLVVFALIITFSMWLWMTNQGMMNSNVADATVVNSAIQNYRYALLAAVLLISALLIGSTLNCFRFQRETKKEVDRRIQGISHNETRLKNLQQTTYSLDLSFEEKLQAMLQLGLKELQLDIGIISHITGEQYEIVSVVTPDNSLSSGTLFALGTTYCSRAIAEAQPVWVESAGESDWQHHPCYAAFKLESYIGTPIQVNGKVYGTLNFSSPKAHSEAFTENDVQLIQIMAQWIGVELEQHLTADQLSMNVDLLAAISHAQSHYISEADTHVLFDNMLRNILDISQSEYGFIGEILQKEGKPFLRTRAITNIAWNDESKAFYEAHAPQGLEFYNLDNLFGYTVLNAELFIANDPANNPHRGKLPEGHPKLNAFCGIPIFHGNELLGMVGLANRPQKYDQEMVEFLDPLLASCGSILWALRNEKQRAAADKELNRFKSTLDRTLDCVFMFNADTLKFFYVNQGAINQIGYSHEELENMHAFDIKPKYSEKQFRAMVSPMLEGKLTSTTFETIHRHKNGSTIPVEVFLQYINPRGEIPRFVAIVRDITERKHTEQKLTETSGVMNALLDSANFSIISTDLDGIIQTFNEGAERMLGYAAEEVIGKVTPGILHDETEVIEYSQLLTKELGDRIEPGFETFIAKAREGIADEREWTYLRKDGTRFPVHLSVTSIKNELDQPIGYLGIGSDITERKATEKMKDEFVSIVSHELRTPLTSIRGSLGLISGGVIDEVPEKILSMIHIAHKNTDRLLSLINDILDINKLESGRIPFQFQPLEVSELLTASIEANKGYANHYQVEFILHPPEHPISINADEDRLMQVMSNLLSNAAKFSSPGSVIEVAASMVNQSVRISVSDNGQGIPESFHDRVFDKFTQQDSTDSRRAGGTGLGLSITKSIVEQHNGTIGFVSEEKVGTVFFFNLPATYADIAIMSTKTGTMDAV